MTAELDLALERRLGKRSATVIEKHLGITTVDGLLNYFPRRYMNRGELTPISELPLDEEVTLIARVLSSSTRNMQARRGTITDVIVSDDDGRQGLRLVGGTDYRGKAPGTLKITFFNGFKAKTDLLPGRRALFSGKVTKFKGQLGLTNPDFQLLDDDPFSEGSHGPGKTRRHAHPGVSGHVQTAQLENPEGRPSRCWKRWTWTPCPIRSRPPS
jgi:ATP-dependent DNA helicase RecG